MTLDNTIPQNVEEIWARIGHLTDQEAKQMLCLVSPELRAAYDEYVVQKAREIIDSASEAMKDYQER